MEDVLAGTVSVVESDFIWDERAEGVLATSGLVMEEKAVFGSRRKDVEFIMLPCKNVFITCAILVLKSSSEMLLTGLSPLVTEAKGVDWM